MFVGHYSVSFAIKKAGHRIPLWQLFLAVQFLDILWSLLIFMGIEKAKVFKGDYPGSPLDLYYIPFTHSLPAALFWSLLAFIFFRWLFRSPGMNNNKIALLMAVAVFSHWVLDLIAHAPDLPLWGNSAKIGFGLYHSAIGTFLVEAILLFAGVMLSWKYTKTVFKSTFNIGMFYILLLLFQANSIWGITPPNSKIAAGFLLFSYLFFAGIIFWFEKRFLTIKADPKVI